MAPMNAQEVDQARKILKAHFNKTFQINCYPEAWRNLSEIPSKDEILPQMNEEQLSAPEKWNEYQQEPVYNADLPVNIIDGPWESKMAYVGSHYQLLREDAVAALRRSVGEVHTQPDMIDNQDTCIYTHVTFTGLQLARIGAAFRVAFSTERASKRIRWEQSKRLLQGTLVALSPHADKFRSICKLAVIAARPIAGGLDQNPPTVDLFWADPNEAVFDPVEKYMMVEARQGYFEASRHMLSAFQKLMTEESALMKQVAFLDREAAHPNYLKTNPFLDLTALEQRHDTDIAAPVDEQTESLFSVNVLEDFPRNLRSTMDSSQLRACQDMLTKPVSIVQGPPGTGKTFTSVAALRVMIENLRDNDPPIIIAAQTNHALDQLLNHVMAFEERIVRLGGRTDKENKKILERTLYELRVKNQDVKDGRAGMRRCTQEYDECIEQLEIALGPVLKDGNITAEVLLENKLITEEQFQSLYDADAEWGEDSGDGSHLIAEWLGDQLMSVPSAPQVNLGLPMEEEDVAFEQAQILAMELDGNENREGEVSSQDKENIEALGGKWVPSERKFTGLHTGSVAEGAVRKLLRTKADLHDIPKGRRGEIYRYWEKQLNVNAIKELRARLVAYQRMVEEYQVVRGLCNLRLTRHLGTKVVGCTTTGLAKYRGFISALQPRTLLIEEAAETLEGTIMAGLVESLEQLILVGDHQQLQAHCTVKRLEEAPYNLNVSMFERLINNGLPYVMLNTQRRMIPAIRKLLCIEPDPFYRNLLDHKTVKDVALQPPIPGMGNRSTYFFHHTWPEACGSDISRYNPDEAEMMAGFFHYLVYNGVDPGKITVLTFYNGQRKYLIKELNKKKDLYGTRPYFKVFTVDSYQGEENDIVLLSLVRSNTNLNIGFLENRNRLVVALSRARRGLYIFGNTLTLTMAETTAETYGRRPLWDPLVQHMREQNSYAFDGGFPITCQNHGNTIRILDPITWFMNTGGCELPCEGSLPCGHTCPLICHPFEHSRVVCKEPCVRILSCGHGCAAHCSIRPCRCDSCEMLEGADGRMYFPDSTIGVEDMDRNRLILEEEDTSAREGSPRTEMAKQQHNRVGFIGGSTRDGSRLNKSSSKRASKSAGIPKYPKSGENNWNASNSRVVQNRPGPRGNSSNKFNGSNFCLPFANSYSGPGFTYQPFRPSAARSKPSRRDENQPTVSDTKAWHNWDAKKADEIIARKRRSEEDLISTTDRRGTTMIEKFYQATYTANGERHVETKGNGQKIILQPPMPDLDIGYQSAKRPAVSNTGSPNKLKQDSAFDLIDFEEKSGMAATSSSKFSHEKTDSAAIDSDRVNGLLDDELVAVLGPDMLGDSLLDYEPTASSGPSLEGDNLLDSEPSFLSGPDILDSNLVGDTAEPFVYNTQYQALMNLDEIALYPADDESENLSPKIMKHTKLKSSIAKRPESVSGENLLSLIEFGENSSKVKVGSAWDNPSLLDLADAGEDNSKARSESLLGGLTEFAAPIENKLAPTPAAQVMPGPITDSLNMMSIDDFLGDLADPVDGEFMRTSAAPSVKELAAESLNMVSMDEFLNDAGDDSEEPQHGEQKNGEQNFW